MLTPFCTRASLTEGESPELLHLGYIYKATFRVLQSRPKRFAPVEEVGSDKFSLCLPITASAMYRGTKSQSDFCLFPLYYEMVEATKKNALCACTGNKPVECWSPVTRRLSKMLTLNASSEARFAPHGKSRVCVRDGYRQHVMNFPSLTTGVLDLDTPLTVYVGSEFCPVDLGNFIHA